MTREQFLEQLRQALSGMKAEELEGVISYYDEMLDDRMEAGMTEEAAVNAMEPVQVIAARVLSEADVEASASRGRRCQGKQGAGNPPSRGRYPSSVRHG